MNRSACLLLIVLLSSIAFGQIPTNGLVAWYPFNGTANDSSGNGNNGTVSGATLTTDRFGNAAKAYSFDGATSFISIPNSSPLSITGDISMSAWIYDYGDNGDHYHTILNKRLNGSWSYNMSISLYAGGTGQEYQKLLSSRRNNPNAEFKFSNDSIQFSQWSHLVVTIKNDTVTFYKNGLNIGYIASLGNFFTLPMLDQLVGLTIGANNEGSEWLNGKIDDIRIYNRALSASEIQSLYHESGWPVPPPTITSFTPTSGPVGTSVSITGDKFNPTANKNIVYFDGLKAVVNTASSTQLTVVVPAGVAYSAISVTDTSTNLTGYATGRFSASFPSVEIIDGNSFAVKSDYAVVGPPYVALPVDLDGDGKPDLVVTNNTSGSVSILRNTSSSGSISFAAKTDFTGGAVANQTAYGDLDGDGKQDIVVSNWAAAFISIFRNTSSPGSISLATRIDISTANGAAGIAIRDLDGDGKPDIVVADNHGGTTLSIFRNTSNVGNISFAPRVALSAASRPDEVSLEDVDNDGKFDLIVSSSPGNKISIFRNLSTLGNIAFDVRIDLNAGSTPWGIAVGDLDGDGKPDLGIASTGDYAALVFQNTSSVGSISFAHFVSFPAGYRPNGIVFNDFDSDGKLDVLVGNDSIPGYISILKNNSTTGTFSFAPKVTFAAGSRSQILAASDLDGDGRPDVVVANFGESSVSVFRNLIPPNASIVPAGLVAWYPFNGSANDSSGNGNDCANHGALLSTDRFGSAGEAFSFNGTSSYLSSGVSSSLKINGSATLAAWVEGTNPTDVVVTLGDNAVTEYLQITMRTGSIPGANWTAGQITSSQAIVDGNWHFVAFTLSPDSAILYVDSKPVANLTNFGALTTPAQPLVLIGRNPSTFFKGKLDDIRIYNRPLSAFEIQFLYHEGGWNPPTWQLQLRASAGSVVDNSNVLGVSPSATDGFDSLFDIPKPPAPAGNYVQLYFPHPEYGQPTGNNFSQDIRLERGLADTVTRWTFEVKTNFDTTVALTFVSDGNIPAKYGMILKDLTAGTRKSLRAGEMNYSFRSGTGGSTRRFEILIGDSIAPTIIISKPNGGEIVRAGRTYNLMFNGADRMGIDSLQIFYSLDAGSTYNKVTTLSGVNMGYSWSVPSLYLNSQASVKIIATDTMGNTSSDASNRVFTIVGDSLAQSFTSGWNLIGTPLKAVDSIIIKVFGDDITQPYYVFDYSQSTGYTRSNAVQQGRGYWLGLLANATIDVVGAPMTDSNSVALAPGFNIVSDPLVVPVKKDSLKFRKGGVTVSYATALSNGWIATGIQGYNKSANNYQSSDTMQLWNGYWIAALQTGVELLVTPSTPSTVPLQNMMPKQNGASPTDWQIKIIAATPTSRDETMVLGVKADATDSFDAKYDEPKAPTPPAGKYIESYFTKPTWAPVLGSKFNADIKSPQSSLSWTFTVASTDSSTLTLSWNLGSFVPDSIGMQLQDLSNGTKINMKTQTSYVYASNGPRQFTVNGTTTGVKDAGQIPAQYELSQNYPNPFNPSTTIKFAIPEAAFVMLTVFDILGRQVTVLVNQQLAAGYYNQVFNAAPLPSGVYFYRIAATASTGTGQTFTNVKKLLLLK